MLKKMAFDDEYNSDIIIHMKSYFTLNCREFVVAFFFLNILPIHETGPDV